MNEPFTCQDCGKQYIDCKCKVYRSYFAGTGRMTASYTDWKAQTAGSPLKRHNRKPKRGVKPS